MARKSGWIHPGTTLPTEHPTTRDLEWAAGFLEGEGYFGRTTPVKEYSGNTERVVARQNNPEPLDKLFHLFGGKRATILHRKNLLSKLPSIEEWRVQGVLARGVMMTLYTLLSKKRQEQIRVALGRA